jgi:hypothetical protein
MTKKPLLVAFLALFASEAADLRAAEDDLFACRNTTGAIVGDVWVDDKDLIAARQACERIVLSTQDQSTVAKAKADYSIIDNEYRRRGLHDN